MYDAVCLASGGLDSLVCLHLLRQQGVRVLPVFVNYGQRNCDAELRSLLRNVEEQGFVPPIIVDFNQFGKIIRTGLTDDTKRIVEDAFTPNRNLLFLLLGASVAHTRGVSSLVLGLLSEKTAIFSDQTDRFLSAARRAISESLGANIEIVCPLRDMVKDDVVRLAATLDIKHSYSCHDGGPEPCGRCIACLEYSRGA